MATFQRFYFTYFYIILLMYNFLLPYGLFNSIKNQLFEEYLVIFYYEFHVLNVYSFPFEDVSYENMALS